MAFDKWAEQKREKGKSNISALQPNELEAKLRSMPAKRKTDRAASGQSQSDRKAAVPATVSEPKTSQTTFWKETTRPEKKQNISPQAQIRKLTSAPKYEQISKLPVGGTSPFRTGTERQEERPTYSAPSSLTAGQPSSLDQYDQVVKNLKTGAEKLDAGQRMLEDLRASYEANPSQVTAANYDRRLRMLRKELEKYSGLVDQYNYYISSQGIKERVDELQPLMEAAERARNDAKAAMAGAATQAELMEWQDKLAAAQKEYDKYSAPYNDLLKLYYNAENQEKLHSAMGDAATTEQYASAQELRSDIDRIKDLMGFMTSSLAHYGDADKARVDARYLAWRYGLDESAIKKYSEGGAAGYEALEQLRQRLEEQLEKRTQTLAEKGYDFERMDQCAQMQRDAEAYVKKQEEWQKYAQEHPVQSSIATLAASPFQGIDYIRLINEGRGTSDPKDLEHYAPMNVYNMDATNFVSTVRSTVSKDIEENTDWEIFGRNVSSFLYQTGMSIADSSVQIATMGSASALFMGASAAANQAKNIIERGGTNEQAFWGGLAAGAAEAIFEYVSIDKLLEPKSVGSIKDWLWETLRQAKVEASEEMFTEVANILSDAAIMGQRSDWAQMVQQYKSKGMSGSEAKKRAFLDCVGQVMWASAGGALSGGIMGGAVSAFNYNSAVEEAGATHELPGGQKETASTGEAGTGLIPISPKMQESLSTGKNNFIAQTAGDIVSFVKRALGKKGGPERLYMGSIPDSTAQFIKQETGVDVTGYQAVLPSDSVQHIFKNHGDSIVEATRGQRGVTPDDIALISQVIAAPDSVSLSSATDARGRTVILFSKRIGDTYITAQAVSDGRKSLATDTFWIKKGGSTDTGYNADIDVNPVHNAQNVPPSEPSFIFTLLQDDDSVKGKYLPQSDGYDFGYADALALLNEEVAATGLEGQKTNRQYDDLYRQLYSQMQMMGYNDGMAESLDPDLQVSYADAMRQAEEWAEIPEQPPQEDLVHNDPLGQQSRTFEEGAQGQGKGEDSELPWQFLPTPEDMLPQGAEETTGPGESKIPDSGPFDPTVMLKTAQERLEKSPGMKDNIAMLKFYLETADIVQRDDISTPIGYNPVLDIIGYNPNLNLPEGVDRAGIIFHELAHRAATLAYGKLKNPVWQEAIRVTEAEMAGRMDEIQSWFMPHGKYWEDAFFADIISALSRGEIDTPFSHDKKVWKSDMSRMNEIFADMAAIDALYAETDELLRVIYEAFKQILTGGI